MADLPGLSKYPRVFEPLKLGPVEVRNRVYMPPHGQPFWIEVPGTANKMPAAEAAFYYRERAEGGVALIFYSTALLPNIGGTHGSPWSRPAIDSFARLAEEVHAGGAKIMAEVLWGGSSVDRWETIGPIGPALGSSLAQNFNHPVVRQGLKISEIEYLIEAYATVTRNLREAGWDGIEVHASHGTIVEHFLSPYFNRRDDGYGGDTEGRARFLKEALEATKSEIGPEMAIGTRINADELIEPGVDAAETTRILQYLAPMGLLDFVDLDVSVEPEQVHLMTTTFFEPKHHNLPHIAAVAPAIKPEMVVIATPGRVTSVAEAEELLGTGVLDMVGIGRGHIAEPEIVKNGLEGNERRSRVCIAGNHCLDSRQLGLGCALNPATGREERWGSTNTATAPEARRVVVVGAGPGGLEAARVAARRGHDVVLLEREPRIGGALELWARLPGREHLAEVGLWYERQLAELPVDIRLGIEASSAVVAGERPDVVIVATGSRFSRRGESGFRQLPVPGHDRDFVCTPEDVLEGRAELAGRVVVLDEEGRHAAVGIAEIAARNGAEVDYVTRFPTPARAMAVNSHGRYVVARLRQTGVRIRTSTYVDAIGDGAVTLVDLGTGETSSLEVDAVVLATMRVPEDSLADSLDGTAPYVYLIGDAASPRTLLEATYEGQRFARLIGEPNMPRSVIADLLAAGAAPLRPATSL